MVVLSLDGNYSHMTEQSHENYILKEVFDNNIVNIMNYLIEKNIQKLIMGEIWLNNINYYYK